MIFLWYFDEVDRQINFEMKDWDCAISCAQSLTEAPIDLDYLYYWDGANQGIINLNTFETC